ncbi:ATP-dependent DNA helicase PIF1 [Linum grandiflorum]
MQSVDDDGAGLFFLYGHGGIGKTYLYKCIISEIRSRGHISLAVASSSIAATLLPDGCTAHSLFKIPLEVYHFSTCAVRKGKQLAELLRSATAIIWDEAPMIHRLSYEAVDRTLCEIMNMPLFGSGYKPFGGKIVIFGGDFRQTLPVITDGGRSDTINASLAKSYLWSHCQLLHLTINMRVVNSAINSQPVWGNMDFSKWILSVGDGRIPRQMISGSPFSDLIEIPTRDFIKNRTIVTPTNKVVSEINEYVLSRIPGKTKTYYSSDSITTDVNQLDSIYDAYPTEFLNTLSFNGVPEHELNLKLHTPVMILRNLNPSVGLCNGTRLFLTYLGKNVISGIIMGGNFERTQVVVPRCQFPIRLCYAMTINKSQGQTLDCVGLYLPKPVFSHGQLYVALSRVRSASGFHVLICGENSSKKYMTRNIVYQEIFETLH